MNFADYNWDDKILEVQEAAFENYIQGGPGFAMEEVVFPETYVIVSYNMHHSKKSSKNSGTWLIDSGAFLTVFRAKTLDDALIVIKRIGDKLSISAKNH